MSAGVRSAPVEIIQPDVTIVIPVFNKLDLTTACIESIHRAGAESSFEIVVVDNGSTDGSREWLAEQDELGRLRAVTSDENLGFARGCNVGAQNCRGRYLLFLNNDMEVHPGWLDPLVTTLDHDPEVGIVGARLLFPDRTIQHAGVALIDHQDQDPPRLDGLHMAKGKPADYPGSGHPQLMQIVTGACLMIRPDAFTDAGCFDEKYWNGNEDVDLCLKVGEAGWKVVYRSESVITHHESQSGPERWTKVQPNIQRLNKIWRDRARPDFIRSADGRFQEAESNRIRAYASPRLHYHRPDRSADFKPTASIVVLVWNALDYTKRCVASVLEHTDPRHELILVDNGSDRPTREYLEALDGKTERVKVIYNGKNLGFAAGNNVGIAAARGDCICLLNSDTVVTPGWIESMLERFQTEPRVGLVGPVTNRITGGQQLSKVSYDQVSLRGLNKFAEKRASKFEGRAAPALWLVGFCLLIRRDLIARIGGLDEVFGRGNYEDTDYCLRAFLAGYRAEIALDSFVHHFGSRSFVAGKVDYSAELDRKFAIFRDKWGLDPDARSTGDLNLEAIIAAGYLSPLHFQPLPASKEFTLVPLQNWEASLWTDCGEACFSAGRLKDAERIFQAVLDLRPGFSRAGNDLACTMWQMDPRGVGIADARSILEAVLAHDPDYDDALANLKELDRAARILEEQATEVDASSEDGAVPIAVPVEV